jgi:hypothetical protein
MSSSGKRVDHGELEIAAKCLSTITEKEEAERMSTVSAMSESTVFSSTSGRESAFVAHNAPRNGKSSSNQLPGDLLFLPLDIQTPTQGGFPEGPFVTNIPSRGISRISFPVSQLQGAQSYRVPSVVVPEAGPTSQQCHGIPPLEPPPGFQPVRSVQRTSPPPPSVHSARQAAPAKSISAESHVTFDESTTITELRTSLGSPPANGSLTPPWPLPMPEKSPSMSYTSRHDSQFSDLPSYPGTPGSRFSWPVKPQEVARSWFTRWFIEWWMFEILSWIFSVLCIATIVIVLIHFNGRELPQWKLGITINAFIAIFAGFAKSALLVPTAEALGQLKWDWYQSKPKKMMDFEILDSASRGPWGSMMLLTRSKGM